MLSLFYEKYRFIAANIAALIGMAIIMLSSETWKSIHEGAIGFWEGLISGILIVNLGKAIQTLKIRKKQSV